MNKYLKWLLIFVFVSVGAVLLGYGAYRLYNVAIADATKKIKQGVAEGVGQGVGKSLNPFSWLK